MDADDPELARWREVVARGHAEVAAGRYAEAVARFVEALGGLRALLGDGHPEVEELADDLDAARQMGDVHQWGREMGYRGFGRPSDGEDP